LINSTPDIDKLSDYILKDQSNLTNFDIKNFQNQIFNTYYDKTIMIVGASGFIATQTIFELITYKPKKLILVDINENGLTELIRNLRSTFSNESLPILDPILFDVTHHLFLSLSETYKNLDFIFNFAASKHVRTERDSFSLWRLLNINIIGIRNIILLANATGSKIFSISSDKASSPTNFMGFSKRIMEILLFKNSLNPHYTTRFANVLFSTGSLTAAWIIRLQKNQALAVPLETSRFFIRPIESGQLCILSPTLLKQSEILIPNLDLDHSLKFNFVLEKFLQYLDLAPSYVDNENDALMMSKDKFIKHIPVVVTKRDTSGEKDSEEFFEKNDVVNSLSKHLNSISTSNQKYDFSKVDSYLNFLDNIVADSKKLPSVDEFLVESLKALPQFQPIKSILKLDDRI
jgi:FlaA1/EpsC-like NDP-sugar epimerase